VRVDPSGALELGPADLLPGLREKPPARPAPEHFRPEVRVAAWYAAGAGQRYRVTYDCDRAFEDLTERFVGDAPWEHQGRPEPEQSTIANACARCGRELLAPVHTKGGPLAFTHAFEPIDEPPKPATVASAATSDPIDEVARRRVEATTASVAGEAPGEQVSSAPFVPYSTEDVAEVAKVARMLLERKLAPSVRMTEAFARATLTLVGQVQIPVTKGLLDALVLTPWGPPAAGALIAGRRPEVTHVEVRVNGLPGFRATLEAAACRELQVALEALLGPPDHRRADAAHRVDQLEEIASLVREVECGYAEAFPGEPGDPGVSCAKLRVVLGLPVNPVLDARPAPIGSDEGPDDLTDDELAMMRADAEHGRLEGVTCTYALRAADEIARRRKPR